MSRQGSLGIERMCQLAQVSRAGFYRSLKEQRPREEAMEVRSAIQQVALEQGCPGGARHVNSTAREEAGDQAAVLEGDAERRNEKEARS